MWVFFVWLFEALSLSHTNNNNKMAPVWYCTVGTVWYTYMKGANIIKYRKGWKVDDDDDDERLALSAARCQNMGILEMTKINIF